MEDSKLLDSEKSKQNSMKTPKLKRVFGKAKLFEIRRLVRRIKQLSLKKGSAQQLEKNQRKVSRLEKQLEFLKDLHANSFVELDAAKENGEDEWRAKLVEVSSEEDMNMKVLVMVKIFNIVDKEKTDASRTENNSTKKREGTTWDDRRKRMKTVKDPVVKSFLLGKELLNDSSLCSEPSDQEIEALDSEGDETTNNVDCFFGDVDDQETADFESEVKTSEKIPSKRRVPIDDDCITFSKNVFDSVFVGSLKDGKSKRNVKRKDVKGKGDNRQGQRTRRKQWEKLYGKKANHITSLGDSQGNLKHARKMKMGNKPARGVEGKQPNTKQSIALHPSWEASRLKKKQQSIVEFKGQRITFED